MQKVRAFTSFDFDHDEDLRNLLVGQARHPDSPFDLADWSVKEPLTGDWQAKVRRRIRSVEQLIVLCGEYTDRASGVDIEVRMAQEEGIPYFLLAGRSDRSRRPNAALAADKLYNWTWDNLRALLRGAR